MCVAVSGVAAAAAAELAEAAVRRVEQAHVEFRGPGEVGPGN